MLSVKRVRVNWAFPCGGGSAEILEAVAELEVLLGGGALSWPPCPSAAAAWGCSCQQRMSFILLRFFVKMLLSLLG